MGQGCNATRIMIRITRIILLIILVILVIILVILLVILVAYHPWFGEAFCTFVCLREAEEGLPGEGLPRRLSLSALQKVVL